MSLIEIFREADEDTLRQRSQIILDKIEDGSIDPSTFSIREVYEATVGPQLSLSRLMEATPGSEYTLFREEVGQVRTSAFTNIQGKIILDGVMEGYKAEPLIGEQLFDVFTDRDDGGRWGGLSDIDDDALIVKEGQEYPSTKFGEDYVTTPHSEKRGLRIGVTKEMLHFDKTNLVRRNAMEVGKRVAVNREVRMLRVFIGYVNPYNRRNEGYTATYQSNTALPRTNLFSGMELVDWTDIDAMLQKFADMRDDRTPGEPIEVMPRQLVVMPAKIMTARRILNAAEVRHSGSNIETISANPITENYEILGSARLYQLLQLGWVDSDYTGTTFATVAAADAAKIWFAGDFKKTFKYRTIFPMATITAGPDHPDNFGKDVILQARASERGVPFVVDPWYSMKLTG